MNTVYTTVHSAPKFHVICYVDCYFSLPICVSSTHPQIFSCDRLRLGSSLLVFSLCDLAYIPGRFGQARMDLTVPDRAIKKIKICRSLPLTNSVGWEKLQNAMPLLKLRNNKRIAYLSVVNHSTMISLWKRLILQLYLKESHGNNIGTSY